jgi:hypothetical protein
MSLNLIGKTSDGATSFTHDYKSGIVCILWLLHLIEPSDAACEHYKMARVKNGLFVLISMLYIILQ